MTFVLIAAAALAACGSGDGTSIAINATGTDGNMAAGADGRTGQVSINLPGGIAGTIKLPKLRINAENFDMNGVKLYPGSTISALNIDARDGQRNEDADGSVHLSFAAPADPAKVRDWFRGKLGAAGFKLTADGNGLSGRTDDDKPFRLQLRPDGVGRSSGAIVIGS